MNPRIRLTIQYQDTTGYFRSCR